MPVSVQVDGYLGISDVCLSLPVVIGKSGIERVFHPSLTEEEVALFREAASHVRSVIAAIVRES
jgi:L-lactate dehydrogenase